MKNIRDFLSENFQFLVAKCSVYLNRHVFVMNQKASDKAVFEPQRQGTYFQTLD